MLDFDFIYAIIILGKSPKENTSVFYAKLLLTLLSNIRIILARHMRRFGKSGPRN